MDKQKAKNPKSQRLEIKLVISGEQVACFNPRLLESQQRKDMSDSNSQPYHFSDKIYVGQGDWESSLPSDILPEEIQRKIWGQNTTIGKVYDALIEYAHRTFNNHPYDVVISRKPYPNETIKLK